MDDLTTTAEHDAMQRALALATTPGLPLGPNPRVGCVLLRPDGTVLAEGFHHGAGTAHAEVDALSRAPGQTQGCTAVVTLEPCHHTGRTGPCTQALIEAGVARVVVATADPNPAAAGGADALRSVGVDVVGGLLETQARRLNRAWAFGLEHGRPFVTWKLAASLDGRSAATDRTSRWITSSAARLDVHRLRAGADTVLAGTGTVLADDPHLTVRDEHGTVAQHQPLRAVVGMRRVPPDARVLDDAAETALLRTRDPGEALATLFDQGRRHVFLEGGPTLAAAFWRAGLIDEVVAYVAPVLLGAGTPAVADLGIGTIADAARLDVGDVTVIHDVDGDEHNVRLTLRPR